MPVDVRDNQAPAAASQVSLASFAYNGNPDGRTTVVPAGLHALVIAVPAGGLAFQVLGVQSNLIYTNGLANAPVNSGFIVVPILSVLDTSVTWNTPTAGGPAQTVTLIGIYDLAWVTALWINGAQPHVISDPVTHLQTVQFSVNVNGGATSSVIAAVGGKAITLLGWSWSYSPTTGNVGNYLGELQDSIGLLVDAIPLNYATVAGVLSSPRSNGPSADTPITLATGRGLVVANPGVPAGDVINAAGWIAFTQL